MKPMGKYVLAMALIGAFVMNARMATMTALQVPLGPQRPGSEVRFIAGSPPQPVAGQDYNWSFCTGAPARVNQECGGSFNPSSMVSGGNPPYHFVLDSGVGFPPMGMSVDKDGILRGSPRGAGTSRFRVCAVDLSGSQSCQNVEINVAPKSSAGKGSPAKKIIIGTAIAAGGAAAASPYLKNLSNTGSRCGQACVPDAPENGQGLNSWCVDACGCNGGFNSTTQRCVP
jgi:hypothetical protein